MLSIMEVLILIFLFVALFLIGSGKRSSSRPSYGGRQKPKLRSKQAQRVKQYEFNPKYFKPFEGKAHVIDGDTIVVKRQKIRLAGVNAPELDQAWGQKSKWEMVKILKGKVVKVVPNGETSYDRIVATCYIDGDKDIDLDKLAAAEDEFDFLAGTDECATKLDLARAYIDMEDMDGARELLQEVLQEGSDQQKQDARSLMDNMS